MEMQTTQIDKDRIHAKEGLLTVAIVVLVKNTIIQCCFNQPMVNGFYIRNGSLFLAVQDSSISDIVGLSVGRSEPTNNQSLGSIKE